MKDNLYQRKGTWWIRYNVDGRQVRQSLKTKSLKKAKELRNEVLGRRDAARDPRAKLGLPVVAPSAPEPRPVPTLGELADKWLKHREQRASLPPEARGHLTEHSRAKSETAIKVHIRPGLGARIMSTITREDVEAWLAGLRKRTSSKGKRLSETHVANLFSQLRSLVRWSLRRGLYEGADFTNLEAPPRPGPGRDVVLTTDEARALLAQLDGRYHVMASVALYAGLRWGEVSGLAWDDLDLAAEPPKLTVRRSFRDGKPKTKASGKPIPLHAELAATLRRWKDESSSEWVFPAADDLPARQASTLDYETLAAAAKAADIRKHVTPHVFRHSFGTLLYEATEDPRTVQALMRHTDFRTSLKYIHERRDLADKVNALPSLAARPKLRSV